MASENRTEYKVVADRIVSPDNNINFVVEGNVYVGASEAGNRVATISDVGSGGGGPLVVPVNIKDGDDANFITFTRTGTGTARIATPQDDLSLRSARDITLIAGDDGPGNVYIGWGDATITPDATNRVATIADVQAGTADFAFTTIESPDYESTMTVTNNDMVIKTVVDTEASGNIRVESAQNVSLDASGTMSLRVNNGTADTTAQVVMNPSNHAVKLEAKGYTNSDTFYASNPDWATGTWNTDGTISFTDATNLMNYLGTITDTVNNSDIKIYVDETLAGTFSGGSWGGGNVTIETTGTPPNDTVTIVAIVFEYVYASRVEIDYDNGSIEIYSPDVNVNITGGEDVNITALTDDIRVRANDDIFFTANYQNGGTEHQWSMQSNGTFKLPAAGVIDNDSGDIILTADGGIYKDSASQLNQIATLQNIADVDIPVTSVVYVDYLRNDDYTASGSQRYPHKTLAAALSQAETLSPSGTNPIRIVLVSGNTSATAETVTLTNGHIFIVGEHSSGTHAPILWYGQITFNGAATSISDNHFSMSGLMVNAVSGTTAITFTGTNPQRLFLKDLWLTGNGAADAMIMNNSGTGSTVHGNDVKFSHNGTGHYHAINILAGTANMDAVETSGALTGIFGVHGSLNLSNSEIDSAGSYGIDVYSGGTLSAANCKITTTAADSFGIKLAAGGAAIVGNTFFNVPAAGSARAISGEAGSFLYYLNLSFTPGGNDKISSAITSALLDTTPSFVA